MHACRGVLLAAGTHDNETMEGWWKDSATDKDKAFIKQYLGLREVEDISWVMLREAFKSISRTSIVMMQVGLCAWNPLLSRECDQKGVSQRREDPDFRKGRRCC